MAFGDGAAADDEKFQTPQYIMYLIQVVIIALVMMNLLIAIISDTYANVMAKIDQASNAVLVDIILELETFVFWGRYSKAYGYVIFAEYLQEPSDLDVNESLIAFRQERMNSEKIQNQKIKKLGNKLHDVANGV